METGGYKNGEAVIVVFPKADDVKSIRNLLVTEWV